MSEWSWFCVPGWIYFWKLNNTKIPDRMTTVLRLVLLLTFMWKLFCSILIVSDGDSEELFEYFGEILEYYQDIDFKELNVIF